VPVSVLKEVFEVSEKLFGTSVLGGKRQRQTGEY
jgi:hypothetical protein